MPGAHIWTDSHKCYSWIGLKAKEGELSPVSGYRHSKVIHKNKQFAKGPVSTNAVEGLFSRVKRFLSVARVTKVRRRNYGLYLGEFLWREKYLSKTGLGSED